MTELEDRFLSYRFLGKHVTRVLVVVFNGEFSPRVVYNFFFFLQIVSQFIFLFERVLL